jgi:hypothetical protein
MSIGAETSPLELAALVSQALEAKGIRATLSGGGAVSIYTENLYESRDLDFVTSERRDRLAEVLATLGFSLASDRRHFAHPGTDLFLEFPGAPLAFGHRVVEHDEIPKLETPWGEIRIVTPTLCVMDRLVAFWHWRDRQCWDQAVMVAERHAVDYDVLHEFAQEEGVDPRDIERLRERAGGSG